MSEIYTKRLKLIALTLPQLRLYLYAPRQLEEDLGFRIARDKTREVRRAIEIKIVNMSQAGELNHPWYTYWLIVIAGKPYGAGLVGFKGYPNNQGEAEIGYGLDVDFQNRGYTTEAVIALIAWAFAHDYCQAVVADTHPANIASQRVLEKAGMHLSHKTNEALFWRIDRALS